VVRWGRLLRCGLWERSTRARVAGEEASKWRWPCKRISRLLGGVCWRGPCYLGMACRLTLVFLCSAEIAQTDHELAQIRREKEELQALEARMRELQVQQQQPGGVRSVAERRFALVALVAPASLHEPTSVAR
jgi:hypothetical protein